MRPDLHIRRRQRFDRQFDRLARFLPGIERLRSPGWTATRAIVGMILIVGGIFGALPVLGFWMIPLGLLLLATDIPALQGPVAALVIRGRRRARLLRRRWKG